MASVLKSSGIIKSGILFFLNLYRSFISPWLGSNCRFYPSCSAYFYQAVEVHGSAKGSKLGILRLLKCHPFHQGGVDEVPQ